MMVLKSVPSAIPITSRLTQVVFVFLPLDSHRTFPGRPPVLALLASEKLTAVRAFLNILCLKPHNDIKIEPTSTVEPSPTCPWPATPVSASPASSATQSLDLCSYRAVCVLLFTWYLLLASVWAHLCCHPSSWWEPHSDTKPPSSLLYARLTWQADLIVSSPSRPAGLSCQHSPL